MTRLSKYFGKSKSSPRAAANVRPSSQLTLETLESRTVPSTFVTSHGGLIIPHVKVENVFYGQDWYLPANQTTRQQLDSFMSTILQSPYMSMLGEYGVGKGTFVKDDVAPDMQVTWGNTVTEAQIRTMLKNEIQPSWGGTGWLDEADGSHLYVVYLPPNVHSQQDQTNNTYGHHNSFTMNYVHSFPTIFGPIYYTTTDTVNYAVMVNPTGNPPAVNLTSYTTFQQQTAETTHELAEAVTDPDLQHGWFLNDASHEIGDLANQQVGWLDGYLVQREWSNAFQRGELPLYDTGGFIVGNRYWLLGSTSANGYTAQEALGYYDYQLYFNWQIASGDYAGWYIPA